MNKLIFSLIAFVTVVPFLWVFDIRIPALLWLSFVISILLLVFRYRVISKIVKNYELSENDEIINSDLSPSLITINGFGTRFYGSFRQQEGLYVTYEFFCILFIPIVPIGCYLVSDVEVGSYHLYGHVAQRKYELADIYLKWYGWIGGILSLLFLLIHYCL